MLRLQRWLLLPAAIAVALMLLSGPGVRLGWWDYPIGFALLRWSVYAGLAAAAIAGVALASPALRRGQIGALSGAAAAGLLAAWLPWQWAQQGRGLPPIHDISTDLIDPPAFSAVLPLRTDAPNSVAWGGPDAVAAQHSGYPDIAPLTLELSLPAAFNRALEAARLMRWDIVAADDRAGRIEATATTIWFGFKDDVVIRVTRAANGTRIDVRSLSRVGQGDLGINAKRVRAYLASLSR